MVYPHAPDSVARGLGLGGGRDYGLSNTLNQHGRDTGYRVDLGVLRPKVEELDFAVRHFERLLEEDLDRHEYRKEFDLIEQLRSQAS